MPERCFTEDCLIAMDLITLSVSEFPTWLADQNETTQAWITTTGFTAKPGTVCLIPHMEGGGIKAVAAIPRDVASEKGNLVWHWAACVQALPPGTYKLNPALDYDHDETTACILGWALSHYSFERYRQPTAHIDEQGGEADRVLVWPDTDGKTGQQALAAAQAISLVRNLINTPANHMSPQHLAEAASDLANLHGAACSIITGEALLEANYPAIHAVGRASDAPPCLIDLRWKSDKSATDLPKITLVGKGVCFDSGGLDLKPAVAMKLMKKDMGGAAHALGLASMIMDSGLPVQLRVLIPAVENMVSGNAMRPMDVVDTRKGLTIEIGNTDAEGRVILADALYEAACEQPDLIIDFATLTGAARIALGTDLPALFCNNNEVADQITACAMTQGDPLWRMPLWPGYNSLIAGKVADLTNSPESQYGGALTAALLLERFVCDELGNVPDWVHLDLLAWNLTSRPGRPEGGEAMTIRAVFAYLSERFG